jgi:hypothetical protein
MSQNLARMAFKGMSARYPGYIDPEPRIVSITVNVLAGTEDKITSFATLAEGWDYGRGGAIAKPTIETAVQWNSFLRLLGFLETDAFPGGDGEVAITAGYGIHHLEIIVEPDLTISIAYDHRGKQKLYLRSLAAPEATWAISRIAGEIWSASDYYTPINMTHEQESSQDLPSGTRRQMGHFQSLEWTAFNKAARRSAPTSDNSIWEFPGLWGIHPSSGGLNPAFFRKDTR